MADVYHSSTLGRIPLSFTGRYHLQRLRYAITTAIKAQDYHANADELSRVRGELAQYMSQLESRQVAKEGSLKFYTEKQLRVELEDRRKVHWMLLRAAGFNVGMGRIIPQPQWGYNYVNGEFVKQTKQKDVLEFWNKRDQSPTAPTEAQFVNGLFGDANE